MDDGDNISKEERRKAEAAFSESEQKYRCLVETTNTGFVILDGKGRVLDANDEYVRLSGHKKQADILGRSVVEWTAEHDRERNAKEVKKCLKQGFVRDLEIDYLHQDGTFVPIEINATVMGTGDDIHILTLCRDITRRRRQEEALRESEDRTRRIIESVPIGFHIYRLGPDGRLVFIGSNPAADLILGIDNRAFIGKTIEEAFPPLAATEVPRRYREVAATGIPWQTESIEYQDSIIKGMFKVHAFRTGPNVIAAAFEDITKERLAEKEIAERGAMVQQIMDTASVGIGLVDMSGRFTQANKSMADMFGFAIEELIGSSYLDHVHPNERINDEKSIRAILSGEVPSVELDRLYMRKDGMPFWGHLRCNRFFDSQGNCLGLIGVITDITERKYAEEALLKSEERYRSIVDTTTEWIWEIDLTGNHTFSNHGVTTILGYEVEEFIGKNAISLLHEEDRQEVESSIPRLIAEKRGWRGWVLRWRHKDGTYRHLESNARPLINEAGECVGFLGADRDITERIQIEEDRLRAQKLESIGIFAGGIAHDFNNLLQGIFGYIAMAKLGISDKERSLAMLEQAENALQQSVSLTNQLLTFSKGGKPVKKLLSLMPLIENSARLALSGSQSDLRLDYEPGFPQVVADEGQIGQVIQNLVLNAEQAMPGGGTIVICLRNVMKPDSEHPQLPEGAYVEICVQDSGIGIPERYLQKIFDPYFTTKDKGSGLGLATSYSIIKNHDGLIDVISEMGRGSTFRIFLPAAKAEEKVEAPHVPCPSGRRGKILVMDDEELVRNVARELIAALGHEAEFAEHGEAAIEKFSRAREAGRSFDVVILDLTVRGGMGGRETIQRLREIDPFVAAIVSSGYSDDAVVADYQKHGFKARLSKPYRLKELQATLDVLLRT